MELCSLLCASLDGKGVGVRMGTCICMAESLHYSPETIKTLLIGYSPIQNVFGVKKIEIEYINSTVYLKFSTFYFKCIDIVFPLHQKKGGEREREMTK